MQGYAINEKRLQQKKMRVQHLKTGIQILIRAIQEKAAMLVYLISKNHAFTDDNKRIAAACFLLLFGAEQFID
ncbi:MAG TPA: Fic family protein [Saprospiraceae bacterium]|nr:Fic family protein [Saprospiraceae bacterium]